MAGSRRGLAPGVDVTRTRIAVLASGGGTNLAALFGALDGYEGAGIALVASDRESAGALDRARRREVETAVIDPADESALIDLLARHEIDWIVLAGYLRIVPPGVVDRYRNRILNIHPALLPDFGGVGMYGARVHEAVLASGTRESGPTVHIVDEEYDHGPIVAQTRVPVLEGDTPETLAARVLDAEHALLPRVVIAAVEGRIRVEGARARIVPRSRTGGVRS